MKYASKPERINTHITIDHNSWGNRFAILTYNTKDLGFVPPLTWGKIGDVFWALATFAYTYPHVEFHYEIGVYNFGGHPLMSGGTGALFAPDPPDFGNGSSSLQSSQTF